jgi:hypothetical protein
MFGRLAKSLGNQVLAHSFRGGKSPEGPVPG